MNKINQNQLQEYLSIFGKLKMQSLLKDYLAQSNKSWENIKNYSKSEKQRLFHCWRSSSLVFGMEDFSNICTKIEDDFINNRTTKLSSLIDQSQKCYENSVIKVIKIIQEDNHE